ncbi:hydrolase [Klebsiella pneumoniae]|uniref:Hydrolase n=1 Tax=Klebsiella pneumoniae TaxID=573 RepID=A0A378FWV5_KLEPN|nr:hydrolase [Klebsiella pneumoniae]
MKLSQIAKNLALAGMLLSLSITTFAAAPQQDATPATREANQALYRKLPFADKTDFNNAHQGFIAPCRQRCSKAHREILSGIPPNMISSKKAKRRRTLLIPACGDSHNCSISAACSKLPTAFTRSVISIFPI